MANKLLVVIGGPTGVGKTAMAIQLARHFKTEIISADARQVYEELCIGVGRPGKEQLSLIPHHLIGYVSIHDHYSVGDYLHDALDVIHALFDHHDIVFLTGGTGLYVKAIMQGLDEMPEVQEHIQQKWTDIWNAEGIEALQAALKDADPQYFNSVDRSNPMRLIRALSVSEASGRPYSSFRKGTVVPRSFDILPVVLDLPRDELYRRINQRVQDMLKEGWLEEARALLPFRHLKALQTVGYAELFDHLEGKCSMEQAVSAIQQSTRRYAKRQLTWWRHQGEWVRFHASDLEGIIQHILAK